MVRRPAPTPHEDEPDGFERRDASADGPDGTDIDARDIPDLSALPIAGITRRRLAGLIGALLAAWIVVVFARQVGEAQAAASRAERLATDNVTQSVEVAGLARELDQIQRQRYIEQQARGYRLGGPKEIAFTLAPDAPPLADDAPGSASVRLGAERTRVSPLERWLTLLFGPGD
jgi:cell division protein FtsB